MGSLTEPLIANHILKYCHFAEWKVVKPYLICKQFYEVFSNAEFAKNYLINLFKLSEYELAVLNETIDHFSNLPRLTEPKKKKKKRNAENAEEQDEILEKHQVYVEILQLYVKCNFKNKDFEVRVANKRLQKKFNDILGEWKLRRKKFTVDLKELISNHKGIFMIGYEISKPHVYSYGSMEQNSKFILFTHCGFPLIFRNRYKTYLELDHCSCDVDEDFYLENICSKLQTSSSLFSHNLYYSPHNDVMMGTNRYSKHVFSGIIMSLFHPLIVESCFSEVEVSENSDSDNEQEEMQDKIMGTILYDILNCSLVESSESTSFYYKHFSEDEHKGLPLYKR